MSLECFLDFCIEMQLSQNMQDFWSVWRRGCWRFVLRMFNLQKIWAAMCRIWSVWLKRSWGYNTCFKKYKEWFLLCSWLLEDEAFVIASPCQPHLLPASYKVHYYLMEKAFYRSMCYFCMFLFCHSDARCITELCNLIGGLNENRKKMAPKSKSSSC